MKNLLLIVLSLIVLDCSAQLSLTKKNKSNPQIDHQVDSLKKSFMQDGFLLLKETRINMKSENEMPVVMPLKEGEWYQIVYVGEPSSEKLEVSMFDYMEKEVYHKQSFNNNPGNIISYDFQPNNTEWHMIKPLQVNQEKKECTGYIMLLKKVKGSEPLASL